MADGMEYQVNHPDFVLASSDTPNIILEEPDGRVHFLSALLVTSVNVLVPQAIHHFSLLFNLLSRERDRPICRVRGSSL